MAYFLAGLDAKGKEKGTQLERGKGSVSWGRGEVLNWRRERRSTTIHPSSGTDF